jgi:hypothetical protein
MMIYHKERKLEAVDRMKVTVSRSHGQNFF